MTETLPGVGDAPKRYTAGTHRVCAPEETLERVVPMMGRMGITRLANVTGLDRIGIPVVMATRPNSRSISVSQGKGMTVAAAKASALMESVETHHAEEPRAVERVSSWRALAGEERVLDPDALPKCAGGAFHADLPIRWLRGRGLASGDPVWVPAELVHTDYTLPGPDANLCFSANTNGLASGNHTLEAICHALCEVIERDATTLWQLRLEAGRRETVLDPESVDDEGCRALLARFADAGVDVKMWDVTTDVGVAVFYCLVVERDAGDAMPEFGAGCHPSRAVALARALTEAAQARTTFVAGSRDDFEERWYSAAGRRTRTAECRRIVEEHAPARRFDDVPHAESATLAGDLDHLLARLAAVDAGEAAFVDLTREEFEIPVVRAIVPGLEGPLRGMSGDYVPGERGRALLEAILGVIACLFVGPTLPAAEAAERLDALVLPPARQGDVYRAVSRLKVDALGLVDGYFASVPSVWHKELLWALGAGVRVYGAASMGALRAAELADFGMRGCGRIFDAYRAGVFAPFDDEPFEDDDEVAVLHGPAIARYAGLSEAMVNVRATLARAADEGVVGWGAARSLARIAKAIFYAERTWERVLEEARGAVPGADLEALEGWLAHGRVDQKREDALVLLDAMAADAGTVGERPGFEFAHTRAWERLASTP